MWHSGGDGASVKPHGVLTERRACQDLTTNHCNVICDMDQEFVSVALPVTSVHQWNCEQSKLVAMVFLVITLVVSIIITREAEGLCLISLLFPGGPWTSPTNCGHNHVWTKSLVPARLLLLRWVRGDYHHYQSACFTARMLRAANRKTSLSSAQYIVKVDGKRGLFRGLSPRIVSSAISTVVRSKVKQVSRLFANMRADADVFLKHFLFRWSKCH